MVREQFALGGNYFETDTTDSCETYSPHDPNGHADLTIYGYDQDEIEWRLEANCSGTDQDVFFPSQGGETTKARRICQGCTVRAECWEAAVVRNEKWGIWGGFAHKERVRVRRLVSGGMDIKAAIRTVDSESEHKLIMKNQRGPRGRYPRSLSGR